MVRGRVKNQSTQENHEQKEVLTSADQRGARTAVTAQESTDITSCTICHPEQAALH